MPHPPHLNPPTPLHLSTAPRTVREIDALRAAKDDAETKHGSVSEEHHVVKQAHAKAQALADEHHRSSMTLREEMSSMLAELEAARATIAELDIAEKQAHESHRGSAQEVTNLARDATELRAEVARIKHSKQMLQKAMLDQLSAARRELRDEQVS